MTDRNWKAPTIRIIASLSTVLLTVGQGCGVDAAHGRSGRASTRSAPRPNGAVNPIVDTVLRYVEYRAPEPDPITRNVLAWYCFKCHSALPSTRHYGTPIDHVGLDESPAWIATQIRHPSRHGTTWMPAFGEKRVNRHQLHLLVDYLSRLKVPNVLKGNYSEDMLHDYNGLARRRDSVQGFQPNDLLNPGRLALQLRRADDPVSRWVVSTPSSRTFLLKSPASHIDTALPPVRLRAAILAVLNDRLDSQAGLLPERVRSHIRLSEITGPLVEHALQHPALWRRDYGEEIPPYRILNRLLLAEAYPSDLVHVPANLRDRP